jgi:pimeloyl-ACP methyl ester carboxylesterase
MNRAASRPAPRVRRAYFDCRFGQLHVHNTVPAGGGFDELTTVICLHAAGESGRVFVPVCQLLGSDRSVFALDLPGCGESDPAEGVEPGAAGAMAVMDFVHSMRLRSYDLIARGNGCDMALLLAKAPESPVRRMVLVTDHAPGATARPAAVFPLAGPPLSSLGERLVQALV